MWIVSIKALVIVLMKSVSINFGGMRVDHELAKTFIECLEESGKDCEFFMYEGYVGRGLSRKPTTGIVIDSLTRLIEVALEFPDRFILEDFDETGFLECKFDVPSFNIDSLGLQTIVY